jgi:internalin A
MKNEAYLAAEKKIKQALKSGATELDLDNMGLTELPESIGQLTQLTELNLGVNRLTALPEWIRKLIELQVLKL